MFRKKNQQFEDEWEFDTTSSSFDFYNDHNVDLSDDEEDTGTGSRSSIFSLPVLHRPSFLGKSNFSGLVVSLPLGYTLLGVTVSIVTFGFIGAFYTSFSKPNVISYDDWLNQGYVSQVTNVVHEIDHEENLLLRLPSLMNNPIGANVQAQQIQQNIDQMYLFMNRLAVPSDYTLPQSQILSAIDEQSNVINNYMNFASTNQDKNKFLSSIKNSDQEVRWLVLQWKKVK